MYILDKIEYWAGFSPKATAIRYNNISVSYEDLNKLSTGLSSIIIKKLENVSKQVPVMILCKRSEKFIIAILGVMKSGNYYVPIELPHPKERIKHIAEQLGDYIVITDEEKCLWDGLDPRKVLYLDDINNEGAAQLDIKNYKGITQKEICYIMFTSGSTGVPKGVLLRYESLNNLVINFLNSIYLNFKNSIYVGVLSSFSFDASIKQIFGALYYGHSLVIAKKEERMFSRKIQNFIDKNKISIIDGTPSIYKILMQQQCNILWQVKYFLIGGEMLSWDFVNSFYMYLKYKPIIVNVYGPTECCVDASSYWINDLNFNLKGKNVYIGKPIPNAKFQIYKNSNEIAKVGEVGELYISGVLVGEGYWGHPEDDSFYFDKDYGRTYKTGDLAILHADNNFEIIGRKDEQVKVHGNRLELEEVRVKLANIIANNNVEVIFDSKNEKLYAFVYDNIGKNAKNEKKIMDILRCQLPAYGMPNHIIFCKDYFPINANGKVDKEMLLLKYLNA